MGGEEGLVRVQVLRFTGGEGAGGRGGEDVERVLVYLLELGRKRQRERGSREGSRSMECVCVW